ncbi:MAG: hypothetical protein FIA97_05105 [Methylococcaceae bacterium]|nr:hypothetical protein [Methylococcaceae bacterium]
MVASMRRCPGILAIALASLVGWAEVFAGSADPGDPLLPVADEIRREATLPAHGPIGRPLPLAGHWNTGTLPNGFSPDYQMDMIRQGHYLLPWFQMPKPDQDKGTAYYEAPVKKAAAQKLPISLVGTQWERVLSSDAAFLKLPAEQNPNVVSTFGGILPKVSPFGPEQPWRQAGQHWTTGKLMRTLQSWYPNPPLVLFVSNNEHDRLSWTEVETDRRYFQQYGLAKDRNFKRKVVGDGWIPRYRQLLQGMRENLSPAWAGAARFIGYGAFETWSYGLQGNWERFSLHTDDRFSPWPLAWQGASVPYYMYNFNRGQTDHTVYSPQIHAMNWLFMLEEAQRMSPDFWFEISTWDGHTKERSSDKRLQLAEGGKPYGPERYEGLVQFGAWLTRPRVVREFRFWNEMRIHQEPYFNSVMAVVDRVHTDSLLRRFWRKGELVGNPSRPHPFQTDVPIRDQKISRWYLLNTDLDPAQPWIWSTELPVYAIALVAGQAPRREWLVYAFSPQQNRPAVEVEIPGYRTVTVAASPGGEFSHVQEETGGVVALATKP